MPFQLESLFHPIKRIGVCFNFVISSGMEENKKSGGGDVRAKALSRDGEWDKA